MATVPHSGALLKWVNTFPLDAKVESLADLTDGVALSKMLGDIDPAYAVRDIEKNDSPSKWLSKKKSLEAVYRSLLRYIRNHCDTVDPVALKEPVDLNAIAEHDDEQQMVKLLTMFLVAAVNGASIDKYVGRLLETLDIDTQTEIKDIIQMGLEPSTIADITDAKLPPKLTKDLDLAIEEEHAALHAKYEALRKTHADFISRFEHLQRSRDDLLERAEETDRQLKSIQSSNHSDQAEYIKDLIKRKEEAEDLITNQELRIEDDRKIKESQLKELSSLRPAAQRLIELEDHVKELKIENTALSKKANAGKNFERKLEAMKDVEKQNARLREQIDTLGENQRDYDKVYALNEVMKTTIEEYKKQFEAYELGVIEINTQKRVLNDELRAAQAKIFELESRKSHDDDYINQLQEQMRTNSSVPLSPDSPTTRTGLSLGEELERSEDIGPSHELEISRLRAENQLLRSNTAGTDNANLRIDLDEAERIKKRLEELNSELFEKHAIAQHQLQAIIGTSSVEKDEAILRTRNLYMEANQELSAAKSKLAEIQADLTSRDRELLAAKADLAAIEREEIDALEDLKAVNKIITSSLQNDLLTLQSKHRNLTTDFELQQKQLYDAIISKDKVVKEKEDLKQAKGSNEENVQAIVEAENAQKSLKEQIKKQDVIIQDLQRRLKNAEESGPDAQKAANESMIKNLTRENALITTAWYDLTSRLQSNHVVLQRRQDAPKSWLNKQRQMVNATPRR